MKYRAGMRILFVCYGNVARSQLARAYYNYLTKTHDADSAGTGVESVRPQCTTLGEYGGEIDSEGDAFTTIKIIKDTYGVDYTDAPRTQMTPEMISNYDLVVNLAEIDQTPDWLIGENVIWWDISDPGKAEGDIWQAVYRVREPIEAKVRELIGVTWGNYINSRH